MTATKTVGRLSDWSDGDVGEKSTFIKLEEGSNVVRIVSSPYQFYSHWTKDSTGAQRKVRCCLKDCPVCARGEQNSPRWYVACLDYRTNAVGVLELSPQVYKGIKAIVTQKNSKGVVVWGDCRGYDIDIVRGPKGTNPLYAVVPQPKEPLDDGTKTMIRSAMENIDLAKMTELPTPEEICEKLGIQSTKRPTKQAQAEVEDEPSFDSGSGDSDDFDFDAK